MKRQQQEIAPIFEPALKRVRVEPRAIGAGDDGIKIDIRLRVCGKCKKLEFEEKTTYIPSLHSYLCHKCDSKG